MAIWENEAQRWAISGTGQGNDVKVGVEKGMKGWKKNKSGEQRRQRQKNGRRGKTSTGLKKMTRGE